MSVLGDVQHPICDTAGHGATHVPTLCLEHYLDPSKPCYLYFYLTYLIQGKV
jgi:hypothetical protein